LSKRLKLLGWPVSAGRKILFDRDPWSEEGVRRHFPPGQDDDLDTECRARADKTAELLKACVDPLAINHYFDGLFVEPVIGSAHLSAKVSVAIDLGIRDKALRPNRDAVPDDRILDLRGEADSSAMTDGGGTADHRQVANQAIGPDCDRTFDVRSGANPCARAYGNRSAAAIQHRLRRDVGGAIDVQLSWRPAVKRAVGLALKLTPPLGRTS